MVYHIKKRSKVCEDHTTDFARVLFADSKTDVAIAVADGTYIYIEKSGDYSFQRRSYSVHKVRPLVKPMMLVATDGYILTVLGPYSADGKNSDAQLNEEELRDLTMGVNQIKSMYHMSKVFVKLL